MSATSKSWAPQSEGAATSKKKILLLVGLLVVLAGALAFQLPRLLDSGGSSGSAASEPSSTGLPTDELATADQTAAAATDPVAAATAATGGATLPTSAPSAPPVSKATVLAVRSLPAKDPFVPLLGQEPVEAVTATGVVESTPAPSTSSIPAKPDLGYAPSTTPASAAESPAEETTTPGSKPDKPAVIPIEVKPDVAVLQTNGNKQAVAVSEYFEIGDVWFKLLAVGPKTMKISVVDGGFAGGKAAIKIRRGQPVTLVNTATGVEYSLRFTQATAGIPTTSQTEPTASEASTAAAPAATEAAPATESAPVTESTTTTTSSGS